MYMHDCWWIPRFVDVYLWLMLYTHDYWCIPMLVDVYLFVDVYTWLLMYTYVCWCIPMIVDVYLWLSPRLPPWSFCHWQTTWLQSCWQWSWRWRRGFCFTKIFSLSFSYFCTCREGRLVGCLWVGFVLYIKDPVKLCLVNFEDT